MAEIITKFRESKSNEVSRGKFKHFMYCPFTGLGLYNGFRGNEWLKSRIKVFKQFVIPSLQAQTEKNFTLWISWRPEEKNNSQVKELQDYLKTTGLNVIHTFSGVCFFDDKYPAEEEKPRLVYALHRANEVLINETEGEVGYEYVLMTIQPSDDCYHKNAVKGIQAVFNGAKDHEDPLIKRVQAMGFTQGYIMNYFTKEVAEWNPKTNPPFYTIKFPRPTFIDSLAHVEYTALKHDVPGYKAGTPLPSHEWVGDCLHYVKLSLRGFLVGIHSENISTVWDHPYRGKIVDPEILEDFGLDQVEKLELARSWRKRLFMALPYKVKRKLRYWGSEKSWLLRPLFGIIYNGLR